MKIVALDYILLEDYPNAEKWLSQSLAWDPKDAQSWYYLGRTRYKQAHEAMSYLEHAVHVAPGDLRAQKTLAGAYRSLQQWSQEQATLEQAERLAPEDASLHFMLGQVYRKTGQMEKARTEFAASAALHAREATAAEAVSTTETPRSH